MIGESVDEDGVESEEREEAEGEEIGEGGREVSIERSGRRRR